MTTESGLRVLPWAPGLDRDAGAVEVELPGGAPETAAWITARTQDLAESVCVRSGTTDAGLTSVHLSSSTPIEITFALLAPTRDAVALWTPGSGGGRDFLPPAWAAARPMSALDGVPLGCLLGRGDGALLTFAVRSAGTTLAVRAGIVEESAQLLIAVATQLDAAGLEVLIDATPSRFEDAVRRVGAALGQPVPPVDRRNEEPVLCTWYAWHQDIDGESLIAEGRLAADIGFRTLIVDDGWQTGANERGYATCGDWRVETSKIPDAAALVSSLGGHGIQTMWWIGTPFLGERSAARAQGNLPTLSDEPQLGAAVLDPRSRRVRQHLRERLVELVRDTGAAGLKIDFLEHWAYTPDGPPPQDAVGASVPDAALSLLDDVRAALEGLSPGCLLEFREPYVGPQAARRATMLRVADCPMSPRRNRIGIVDLRLATAGVAVHADPVMWGPDDTPERVAQHLHNVMFGVPQVSERLHGMRADHRDVLQHWLAQWRAYREVLLGGALSVTGVADGYRAVEARNGAVAVSVQFAPEISAVPAGVQRWMLVNAHDAHTVLVSAVEGATAHIDVADCRGRPVDSWRTTLDRLTALPVPPGGTATLVLDERRVSTGSS